MGHLILPNTASPADAALQYALLGWPVVPLYEPVGDRCSCGRSSCRSPGKHPRTRHGLKDATSDPAAVESWWHKTPTANIGILTGVGFDVLDVDGPTGEGSLEALSTSYGPLPDGPVAITGRGVHRLFLPTGAGNRAALRPGLDWRGHGGYEVAPPSRHISGRVYGWREAVSLVLPAAPDWLAGLVASPIGDRPVAGMIEEGRRNSTLASLAGSMRRAGATPETILAALLKENEARCRPPLPRSEVAAVAASVSRYAAPGQRHNRTDAGQAEWFASTFGDSLRFDHRRGVWLVWDGTRWMVDHDEAVSRRAIEAARLRHEAALQAADEDREEEVRFSLRMESRARLGAVVDLARALPPIADPGAGWDTEPHLLGVVNGLVDLRSGDLREGHPDDRITMSASVRYDPAASSPRWLRFLREVFNDDIGLIDFAHRAVGYTLTGDCREEVFFLLHGLGWNGKGILMNTLASVMGDYATTVPFAALEASGPGGRPSNDIAALAGKRLVMSSETGVATRFDEARLKSLTGRDPINARLLYHEGVVFQPALKLWLAVNDLPSIADHSLGLWRRVLVIPFRVSFEGARAEKDLDQTLNAEREGILAWAVEGARLWYASGWTVPPAVKAATEQYRVDSDTLARFLAEECVIDPGVSEMAGVAYKRYSRWADAEGLPFSGRLTGTAFGKEMVRRFTRGRTAKGAFYRGVAARLDHDESGPDV
ncbi:MAG TPA: phage/plasmid primase, P4 family [Candidatus Limnocylindrales bacterium]